MLDKLLPYYKSCLQAEGGWKVRSWHRGAGTNFLDIGLEEEWNGLKKLVHHIPITKDNESFLKELQQRKASANLFYGYPLYRHITKEGGRKAKIDLIPVFLQPVQFEKRGDDLVLTLSQDQPPHINREFADTLLLSEDDRENFNTDIDVADFTASGPSAFMRRAEAELADLWPDREGDLVRKDRRLSRDILSDEEFSGFFRTGFVYFGNKPGYTVGLEEELGLISKNATSSAWEQTALGCLIDPNKARPSTKSPKQAIIDVSLLNHNQRRSVDAGLSDPFRVVEGPPGTGKSQVVINILANAFLRGQTAIFTSRNNNAVTVVEDRLNKLAGMPVVIRAGGRIPGRDVREDLLTQIDGILATGRSEERLQQFGRTRTALRQAQAQYIERHHTAQQNPKKQPGAREGSHDDHPRIKQIRERVPVKMYEAMVKASAYRISGAVDLKHMIEVYARSSRLQQMMKRRKTLQGINQKMGTSLAAHRALPEIFGPIPQALTSMDHAIKLLPLLNRLSSLELMIEDIRQHHKARATKAQPVLPKIEIKETTRVSEEASIELANAGLNYLKAFMASIPDRLTEPERDTLMRFRDLTRRLIDDQAGGRMRQKITRDFSRLFKDVARILPVWSATNLSASGALPLEAGMFDLAIIDEASQCDIPSAIPILYRSKRAIIIGDSNQLRHISMIPRWEAQALESKYNLTDIRSGHLLYTNNSLFDAAAGSAGNRITLTEHFRSHPDIISFSNHFWYRDSLVVKTPLYRLARTGPFKQGVTWMNINSDISSNKGGGTKSRAEAAKCMEIVEQLLKDDEFSGSIGVVTPFRAQANLISGMFKKLDYNAMITHDIIVETAHGFQGDERDIIIFSMCYSDDLTHGSRNFLARTANLFNVAITRARASLIIIGDHAQARKSGINHISDFAETIHPEN